MKADFYETLGVQKGADEKLENLLDDDQKKQFKQMKEDFAKGGPPGGPITKAAAPGGPAGKVAGPGGPASPPAAPR